MFGERVRDVGDGFSNKKALEAVMHFVDSWVARIPEPAGPPKEKKDHDGDPTGLDKALEVLKSAEVEKGEKLSRLEKKKEEPEKGPRGSVGALLETRAAERREQLRKKEEERRRHSRGRSRSRKKDRSRKKKDRDSSRGGSRSEESRSSESSQGFGMPTMWGEDELWRFSKRHPGNL